MNASYDVCIFSVANNYTVLLLLVVLAECLCMQVYKKEKSVRDGAPERRVLSFLF